VLLTANLLACLAYQRLSGMMINSDSRRYLKLGENLRHWEHGIFCVVEIK